MEESAYSQTSVFAVVPIMLLIMLTALSTILGMIPIAPTAFWGSMAYAIMGGLAIASLLTLVFLPTLYVTMVQGRRAEAGGGGCRRVMLSDGLKGLPLPPDLPATEPLPCITGRIGSLPIWRCSRQCAERMLIQHEDTGCSE